MIEQLVADEVEYRVRTAVSRVRSALNHDEPYPRDFVDEQVRQGRERVHALLAQPEPSAAQPSIANMAPGTTFMATVRGDSLPSEMLVSEDGERLYVKDFGHGYYTQDEVDPSTIHAVTPPPASN